MEIFAEAGLLDESLDPAGRSTPERQLSAATLKQRMLRTLVCGNRYERAARAQGATLIAGVDEVGRGALFGPVVAAAIILPPETRIRGLRDSKQLLAEDRERLAAIVRKKAIAVAIEEVCAETIDRVNIYQATRIAMTACSSMPCASTSTAPRPASFTETPSASRSPPRRLSPKSTATDSCATSIVNTPATASPLTRATRPPGTSTRCDGSAPAPSIASPSARWRRLPFPGTQPGNSEEFLSRPKALANRESLPVV